MERAFLQISILRFNPRLSLVKLFFSDVYIKSSSQKLLFLFFFVNNILICFVLEYAVF